MLHYGTSWPERLTEQCIREKWNRTSKSGRRITNQRLYTDDIPTSPKRSTYSDIMLKEWLYIAGLLVTIFFYLNISQHNAAVSC